MDTAEYDQNYTGQSYYEANGNEDYYYDYYYNVPTSNIYDTLTNQK